MNRSIPPAVFSTLTIRGQALPGDLAVRRIRGSEGVGRLFDYHVEIVLPHAGFAPGLSTIPDLDLDQIKGTPATVTVNLEKLDLSAPVIRGAGVREISGLIAEIRVLGVETNTIVYEFALRPWSWPATLRRNSRIWNGAILDCIAELLRPYGGEIDWRIANESGPGANPVRDLIRQAWETDWQFFMRLCEEFGYVVWFEHHDARHVLVIADNASAYLEHEAPFNTLPYHATGGHIDAEHVTEFVYSRTVTVGTVTVHDHSYLSPRQNPGSSPYRVEYSDVRDATDFHYETYTPADFAQPRTRPGIPEAGEAWQEDARHLARVKLEATRCKGHCARGSGALRGIQSGKTFTLTDYPHRLANRTWLITHAEIDICELPTNSGDFARYNSECSFEAVPVDEPYRMPQVTPCPRIYGYEYAVIVAPDKREIGIDEHNRVLIQYLWDREGQYDGSKSIWVRLATPWQGEQMGFVAHARSGDAVLVSYINGDPDRPVIAAFVPDRNHTPPWALPANQALSGIRSRSLEHRAESNHVALDDTPGRLQTQIASDHGKSSISLGYNTRIDGHAGRQEARGEGIEARTDFWGVMRAGRGWLMTSFARTGAAAKAKDMGETHARLSEARDIHEELALMARQHGAQETTDNQGDVAKAIKEANARLRGDGQGDFPEFENPDIALSSAANVHVTAERNVHIASSESTVVNTGGNVSIAAARSFFLSIRKTVSMFAAKSITVLTPGPVRIVSRGDQLDLIAQKVINILSARDEIRLTAKRIVMNGSGTELTLGEAGILGFTGGKFLVHAADHATDRAQTVAPATYEESVQYDEQFTLHDANGLMLANTYYTAQMPSGELRYGITDSEGRTERYETAGQQSIKIYMGHKRET